MNNIWPVARRSCLQTWSTFQTCRRIDGWASRLAYEAQAIRPYSISSTPSRQNLWSGKVDGEARRWSGSLGLQCLRRSYASKQKKKGSKLEKDSTLPRKKIYKKYSQLPEDYDDQIGLDYRQDIITEDEIQAIFGDTLDLGTADRFLKVIHGRRVAGTLPDPDEPSSLSLWEAQLQASALHWLRKTVPVDEDDNAILRAEEELAELRRGAGSKNIGNYVPNAGGGLMRGGKKFNLYRAEDSKEPAQGTKSVYGDSVLDAIRKTNQARAAARERKRKEEEEMKEANNTQYNTGTLDHIKSQTGVELRRKGEHPWLKYFEKKAQETAPSKVPELSAFTRLWPSSLLTLLVIGISCTMAHFYIPPMGAARIFPDTPPSVATVGTLIAANAVVLFLWRVPPAWSTLNRYFILIPAYPRALSIIGNAFSHQTFSHFLSNMVVFSIFGVFLHEDIGRANFLAFLFSTSAVSSFASLAWWVRNKSFMVTGLGASRAACAMMTALFWKNREEGVTALGITLNSYIFIGLIFGLEWLAWSRAGRNAALKLKDHTGHFTGYLAGLGAAEVLRWRGRVGKSRMKEEKRQIEGVMTG